MCVEIDMDKRIWLQLTCIAAALVGDKKNLRRRNIQLFQQWLFKCHYLLVKTLLTLWKFTKADCGLLVN